MKSVLLFLAAASLTGCLARHQVKVDPISVKPIHMEVDVNVRDGGKESGVAQEP